MKIHIVQKGDTLWNLAKKYGVSFEELIKANSQLSNPDMIMPGMKIKVPGSHSPQMNMPAGAKKEAPIPHYSQPVKEAPLQQAVQQPVKEMPLPKKEAPIIKEAPKPMPVQPIIHKEKIIVKEMPIAPQPVIPEVDINNYYMVNMANMSVQKPVVKEQPQPAPVQPMPVQPMPVQPMPVQPVTECYPVNECYPINDCMPVTPIMPGAGFCPPYMMAPLQQPYYPSMPGQMMQPAYGSESSSSDESSSHPWQAMQPQSAHFQQQMMPVGPYAQFPVAEVPQASPHHLHHNVESSAHYSGKHMGLQPKMQTAPMAKPEEDCGCSQPKAIVQQPMNQSLMQSTPFGQQQMQDSPYEQQQPQFTPFGQQQTQSMPFGQQQTQSTPFGQQQMQATPFGQQQMPVYGMQQPVQPMAMQSPMMQGQQWNQPFNPVNPMMQNYYQPPFQPQTQMVFPGRQVAYGQPPFGEAIQPPTAQPDYRQENQPAVNQAPFVDHTEGTFTNQSADFGQTAFEMPQYADESNG